MSEVSVRERYAAMGHDPLRTLITRLRDEQPEGSQDRMLLDDLLNQSASPAARQFLEDGEPDGRVVGILEECELAMYG